MILRVGIDSHLVTYRRGMGNFVHNLLSALSDSLTDHSFVLYVDDTRAIEFTPLDHRFNVKVLTPKIYPIWEQVSLPLAAARDKLDILHCPANTAPMLLPRRIKLVLTIHDVMYLLPMGMLPKLHSPYQRLGRQYRRLVVPEVARRAAVIVTDSHHSRQDIVRYLRADGNRVRVVLGAPNRACRPMKDPIVLDAVRTKYGLTRPFILALGAVDPRKNTNRVIEAYVRFREQIGDRYQLAIVGLPMSALASFQRRARELKVIDDIAFAGFVPEEDLVALYNAAKMFVYPSLYEGFGLPILEAMACGTPVVTSPRGSLVEISGAAALMVDPLNVEDIAGGMKRLATDPVLRHDLMKRGSEHVRKFSWRHAAMEILDIYDQVAQGVY